jgi:hypothetical protein
MDVRGAKARRGAAPCAAMRCLLAKEKPCFLHVVRLTPEIHEPTLHPPPDSRLPQRLHARPRFAETLLEVREVRCSTTEPARPLLPTCPLSSLSRLWLPMRCAGGRRLDGVRCIHDDPVPLASPGPPALCVLCMSCNRKPRRDESSSAASGPDEVLEQAHVVTTKTPKQNMARVGGVRYQIPRRCRGGS